MSLEKWSLLIGVIGTIGTIVPLSILAYQRLLELTRKKLLSYLWTMNKSGWAIVKPRYESRMARIEDIIATQKLRDALDRYKVSYVDIDDSKQIPDDKNLILICGPEANKVSRAISAELNLTLQYCYDKELKRSYIFDHAGSTKWWSPSDEEENKDEDIALVAKLSRKTPPYVCILCWGVHGPGTIGAAEILLHREFVREIKRRKHEDFVAIISVPYSSFDAIKTPTSLLIRHGADAYRNVLK